MAKLDPEAGERLAALTKVLMLIPGLSGYEGRVRRVLREELDALELPSRTDRLGNLIATLEGTPGAPSVMLFAHMDQLGFVVRKIEASQTTAGVSAVGLSVEEMAKPGPAASTIT